MDQPDPPAFRALSDATRRSILAGLASAPDGRTAGSIASDYRISRPAVTKHLRVLEEAGLVWAEKAGRRRVYRLDARPLEAVDRWVARYRMFWAARLVDLKRHAEGGHSEGRPT